MIEEMKITDGTTEAAEVKEMEKTIRYATTEGEKILKVASTPYPYLQSADKVVLRFSVAEVDASSAAIEDLKNNTGLIGYYENDELKASYENYTCGSDGLVYGYDSGIYAVSLMRKDAVKVAVEKNTSDIAYIAIMNGIEMEA